MTTDGAACVMDSFEVQVYCVDRAGTARAFGGSGYGPGEFQMPTAVLRGPSGSVGVISLHGLSFASSTGQFLYRVQLSDLVVGASRGLVATLNGSAAKGWPLEMEFVQMDVKTGHVLTSRPYPRNPPQECRNSPRTGSGQAESGGVPIGYATPKGGAVFLCRQHLGVLREGLVDEVVVVAVPSYVDELPNERDVAERLAAVQAVRNVAGVELALEEFRQTPKRWWIGPQSPAYDERGRMWIGTNRDRDLFSYLDVFTDDGLRYLGSVRIRDRLIGYDILDSTLAVLVERPIGEGEVVARRGIDWYDIGGLVFPRGAAP